MERGGQDEGVNRMRYLYTIDGKARLNGDCVFLYSMIGKRRYVQFVSVSISNVKLKQRQQTENKERRLCSLTTLKEEQLSAI